MLVIGRTGDGSYAILGQNRPAAQREYNYSWSATFEEICDTSSDKKDVTPFDTARRGLWEELGLSAQHIVDLRFLALAAEFADLSTGLLGIICVDLPFDQVGRRWRRAQDKEHTALCAIPFDKGSVAPYLGRNSFSPLLDASQSRRRILGRPGPWHPSSRMRLILGLGALGYDVDEYLEI